MPTCLPISDSDFSPSTVAAHVATLPQSTQRRFLAIRCRSGCPPLGPSSDVTPQMGPSATSEIASVRSPPESLSGLPGMCRFPPSMCTVQPVRPSKWFALTELSTLTNVGVPLASHILDIYPLYVVPTSAVPYCGRSVRTSILPATPDVVPRTPVPPWRAPCGHTAQRLLAASGALVPSVCQDGSPYSAKSPHFVSGVVPTGLQCAPAMEGDVVQPLVVRLGLGSVPNASLHVRPYPHSFVPSGPVAPLSLCPGGPGRDESAT